jgi:uncharacterized membrane protein (UPF0127 family)
MEPRRLEHLPRTYLRRGAVIHEARTVTSRLLGLAWLAELPPHHALFLPHCRSVHTFGMRFAIDVAFVDERGRAIRIEGAVPGRRVLRCPRAFGVIESRAGEIERFVRSVS